MKRVGLLAGTAAIALLAAMPAVAEEEIGLVFEREFRGAEGMRTNGEVRDLRWHVPVHSEETVRTDADEHTELEFVDQTRLTVGPNSEVVLDSFVYDPSQNAGDAVITFGKGLFRFVSGEMNEDGYQLKTPSATLAIRGTAFQLKIDEVNNVIVYVESGQVDMYPCNNEKAASVNVGESGFVTARCDQFVRDGNYVTLIDPADDSRPDRDSEAEGGSSGGEGGD